MVISGFISSLVARINAYRDYRRQVRELMSFSDRELRELGVDRADIPHLAR